MGYYVEKMRSDTTEFEVANRKMFPLECFGTLENLSEGQEYDFRVFAVNEVGNGTPSNIINVKIMDDESKEARVHMYGIYIMGRLHYQRVPLT